MAPEHLRAMIGRAPAAAVDRRSDLYSLGMVLGEMLIGDNPFGESAGYSVVSWQIEAIAAERSKGPPSARARRPDIPWTLESILRKCLAPEPEVRYQKAENLADDLRRFLDDRPLRYAPELSRIERAKKYLRRHPRLAATAPIAAAAVLVAVGLVAVLATKDGQLSRATAIARKQAHDEDMTQALCLTNTVIDVADNLSKGIEVCRKTLALYDVPGKPGQEHPDWAYFAPSERLRLAEDQRELLLLLAGALVRQSHEQTEVVRHALDLLHRADAIGGLPPTRALLVDQARYLALLGETSKSEDARRRAEQTPASTARDHYLLATALARTGTRPDLTRAVEELRIALQLNPRHYWSSVQKGVCELDLGNLVVAAGEFGNCIGLCPDFAWGYFFRGCALDRGGKKAEAIEDYSAALVRDRTFAPAFVNRGLALLELKQHVRALIDFDRAVALGWDSPSVQTGRGVALEALGRYQEADSAFEPALSRTETLDGPTRLRLLWAYVFAISERSLEKAQRAFDAFLGANPSHPQALYGRAMIAAAQSRLTDAVHDFDQALEIVPNFVEARRYRAVILARIGEWRRATEDVDHCLEHDPGDASNYYPAACVAALNSKHRYDPAAAQHAVELLQRARLCGVDISKALTDPDLEPIRSHPSFAALWERASTSTPANVATHGRAVAP
jgi:tetratricopeptide (TPR) repeat protein